MAVTLANNSSYFQIH